MIQLNNGLQTISANNLNELSSFLSYDFIKQLYKQNQFAFNEYPNMVNIFGFRNANSLFDDKFDDLLGFCAKDSIGVCHIRVYQGTTTAGIYYSQEKFANPKGVAILKPGFHKNMWKRGLHRGKVEALVQVNEVMVYRDSNKDNNLDLIGVESGLFGINGHPHMQKGVFRAQKIVTSSAACQVWANNNDWIESMQWFNRQVSLTKINAFSYALFAL